MLALDTNVLVYYSRHEQSVVEKIEAWLKEGELIFISTIVEAELLAWPQLNEHDIASLRTSLLPFHIVPVDSSIANIAASIRRKYKTPLFDAIIAATALLHNASLVTRNINDYQRIREIEIYEI